MLFCLCFMVVLSRTLSLSLLLSRKMVILHSAIRGSFCVGIFITRVSIHFVYGCTCVLCAYLNLMYKQLNRVQNRETTPTNCKQLQLLSSGKQNANKERSNHISKIFLTWTDVSQIFMMNFQSECHARVLAFFYFWTSRMRKNITSSWILIKWN